MTLQQLTYLVTVAECGNISEAAERLFISQPSLSTAIHKLEKEMKIVAFVRSKKGVAPTREGEILINYAKHLLEQADNIKSYFEERDPYSPRFVVSSLHYSFATRAFVEMIRRMDDGQYSFMFSETQTVEVIEDVADGRSEIGVLYLSQHNEQTLMSQIRNSGLSFEQLHTAGLHVFLSARHPLAGREILTLEELKPYPYLVFEQLDRNSFFFAEEHARATSFPKRIMVGDRATLYNFMIGLMGFTLTCGVIDSDLNGKHITAVPIRSETEIRIGYIHKKNAKLSPHAVVYVEELKNYLSRA